MYEYGKAKSKKRKWIIRQFRLGRSPTQIAKIQKISRRYVYKLVEKYKKQGKKAYNAKKPGRAKIEINPNFRELVKEIREETDYGSEKIYFTLRQRGFGVSQHIIQRILDEEKLTEPCPKRRRQRKYVAYEWPISNYMWHTDWSPYNGKQYLAFIDDKSRKIMAAYVSDKATEENAIFLLYQAILTNKVCPVIIFSDKGTQFYNSKKDKRGERPLSLFEKELEKLGIEFWTARKHHPQSNGKIEKWFDTMKKRFRKHPEESLQEFVELYNNKRIHHALGYKTPQQVYEESL